ncbi:MAG: hypothetical protein RLW87_19345 [Alphaproteobacteria bacterium]
MSMEPAVQAQFETLDWYHALTTPPPLVTDDTGLVQWTEENRKWFERINEIGNLDHAKAMLCGGIAQIAYIAIKEYSLNKSLCKNDAKDFSISPRALAVKFCIGRRVHGIPLGLLVYAARIQYNHWEEGTPTNPVAKAVFRKLYDHYRENPMFDLAYMLDWPIHRPVTHHMLQSEMGWRSYDNYLKDIRETLDV